MSKADEMVLCIDDDELFARFQMPEMRAFVPATSDDLDRWLGEFVTAFLPRFVAEESPEWRHVCTYAVLRSGGRVFAYRRGESGSEGRLHGRLSIGVGGHVTLDDHGRRCMPSRFDAEMIASAAGREVHEELRILSLDSLRPEHLAGLILANDTPVDRVHVGACYLWDVDSSEKVSAREDCLEEARWMTLDELASREGELENWSRIVLDSVLSPARRTPAPEERR